ncbi:MAG: Na+/H+ antiporter NhaC family protein, partial [Planctomycetaceae bacterium]
MEHPYGWLSLLPPVVAIALAIVTRHAVMSLLVGVFCGALITTGGNFFLATYDVFEVHLWPTIIDPSKLRIFSFTMLMGGLVALVIRSGGMQGFVQLLAPLAKSRRGGQLTTWLMGMLIFFDDYANSLLLGNTFRPVCDRLRISREKLAYIVDSTAAPVAGLSLLSTWVAVEIDFIRQGLDAIGNPTDLAPVPLFVASIPYRFYVLGALVL